MEMVMPLFLLLGMPVIGLTVTAFLVVLGICFIKQVAALIHYGEFVPLGPDLGRLLGVTFKVMCCGLFIVFLFLFRLGAELWNTPYFFG